MTFSILFKKFKFRKRKETVKIEILDYFFLDIDPEINITTHGTEGWDYIRFDWDFIEELYTIFKDIRKFYRELKERDFSQLSIQCRQCFSIFKKNDVDISKIENSDFLCCPICQKEADFILIEKDNTTKKNGE